MNIAWQSIGSSTSLPSLLVLRRKHVPSCPLQMSMNFPRRSPTIAALGLGEGVHQQAVLAELEHLLFGVIAV